MKKFFSAISLVAFMLVSASALAQSTTDEFSDYDREYYLIYFDENVKLDYLDANPKNVVVQDLRVDEVNKWLYVWDETYVGSDGSGANYYDEFSGYLNFTVGNVGWSGMGFAVAKATTPAYYVDFTKLSGSTTAKFHIAMKSTSNISHLLILGGGNGLEGKACVGSSAFIDNNITYQPKADFPKDNKWHLVEIPLTDFTGFASPVPFNDGNYFAILSGNNPGANIAMDAIFLYDNVSGTGVSNVGADNTKLDIIVTSNVVTFVGADSTTEIYDAKGSLVTVLDEAIIGVDELTSGFYIARSGSAVGKFVIK